MVLSRYGAASGNVSLVPLRRQGSQLVQDGTFPSDPIDRSVGDPEPVFIGFFEGDGIWSRELVVRTGLLRWSPFGLDGRESAIFAIQHSSGHQISTMNAGFAQCWFDLVNNQGVASGDATARCQSWGLNSTASTTQSAAIQLWRAQPVPTGSAALQNTYRRWPFVLAPALSDAAPVAFTQGIIGDLADGVPWQGALGATPDPNTAMLSALPPARLGEAIEHLSPLGKPAGGVTKPHIFLFPTTTSLPAFDAWNEALGYDCPRVVFDANTNIAFARRLHSPHAVSRCLALNAACGQSPTCIDGFGRTIANAPAPGISHVRADSSWVMRNRIYVGAPADMQFIEAVMNAYPESHIPNESDPRRRQWKVEFRFGAGQTTYFDHLAHITFADPNYFTTRNPEDQPDVGFGDDGWRTTGGLNNPNWFFRAADPNDVTLSVPAGRLIGFIYRLPPWRNTMGPAENFITGRPFDWGSFDRLAAPNRMVNLGRYRREDGALPINGNEQFVASQWTAARMPYGFYRRAPEGTPAQDFYHGFDLRRGNDVSGAARDATAPAMQVFDGVSYGLRDVRGALAGQWFRYDSANPHPGGPTLAVASESATPGSVVVVEYLDPNTLQGVKLTTCPAPGTPQRQGMMGATCMNMGMSGLVAPENAVLTGTNSYCYEASPGSFDRFYLRFETFSPTGHATTGVRMYRRSNLGAGQCPASGAGAGEVLVGAFVR